ncbi:MAG: tetratricopeptide (TPR) repeat protein [Enterobacterales bacterium]|jgi:tetratricopeptide (TPR) repeat protein
MSSADCKYCPAEPAAYYCDNCDIGFCLNCVPEDSRSLSPRCTLCRTHLTLSNAKHVVRSFWKEGLYFLRLPLSSGIFTTLVIYSLVGALLAKYGLVSTVIGGIYFGLLVMMLFELANLIGEGRTDIPRVQEIWDKGERFLLVRLLLQVGLIAALIISINSLWFTVTLLIIYGLGFPASVIILALEKRFFSAINPFRIIYIITAIGAPYIILYVTLLLALGASLWMQQYQLQGHFLISSLSLLVGFYIWTAWFAMLGYATFQYHQQLGIAVAPQHKHQRQQQQRQKTATIKSAAVKEAEILIAESRHDDALNLLSTAMNQPMAEMDVHRFYLKILVSLDEKKRLNTASKHLVRQFIHQDKHSEAVQVAVLAIELLPDWSPDLASDSYSIALSLINMSRRQYALDLLLNLMTKDGPAELMAKVYSQAAKLMAENFNQDENAIECLEKILSDYPDQPEAEDAKKYLEILKASRGDLDDDEDSLIIN